MHKKGDKRNCKNCKGISVTETFSRIYGNILKSVIEAEYKDVKMEEQSGFRITSCIIDNIFCLTHLIDRKKKVTNKNLHLLFIDLTKAYDSVPLQKLFITLDEIKIDTKLITAVKNLYKGGISKIKIGNKIAKGIEVTKGLRQGCCLSPTLFKIYLQQALKYWKRKMPKYGYTNSKYICIFLQLRRRSIDCSTGS